MDFSDRSLKSQMKRADRLGATYVLIIGNKELEQGAVVFRNMRTKEQESIGIDGIVETLTAKLRSASEPSAG
jgi:histidyl-tRNA synthetase